MATTSIFPDNMMRNSELSLETIASKFTYFHTQLQFLHWKAITNGEHVALGDLYEYVYDQKDVIVEALMGCMERKIRSFKVDPVTDNTSHEIVVNDLLAFLHDLKEWAETNHYDGVEDLAGSLHAYVDRVKYRLTMP